MSAMACLFVLGFKFLVCFGVFLMARVALLFLGLSFSVFSISVAVCLCSHFTQGFVKQIICWNESWNELGCV